MNKIVKRTIKDVIAVAFVLFAVYLSYRVVEWKDTSGDYYSSVKQLYATDDNRIDVVFMGSSHCYCGINPAILWEDEGIAAFDMSISGQDSANAIMALKELLKTQSPKVVYVDMYALYSERGGVEGNIYRNTLPWKFSKDSVKYLSDYIGKEERMDYITRFPIVHTRYRELGKNDFVAYEPNRYARGEGMNFNCTPVSFGDMDLTTEAEELSDFNKAWLDELRKLSEENGFELELIVIPTILSHEERVINNSAKAYADKNGMKFTDYCDLFEEIGLDEDVDFVDYYHLSAFGAAKFTSYLEKKSLTEYSLPDHRGDQNYTQWDKDLERYKRLESQNRMENLSGYELADYIAGRSGYITIINYEPNETADAEYFFEIVSPLGVEKTSFTEGGTWIIDENGVTMVGTNTEGEEPYYLDLNRYDTLKISYHGFVDAKNIMVGREEIRTAGYCMSVVIYDEVLQEVVVNTAY